jgi:hypothetical protein
VPVPILITAHQGALPEAWLGQVPNDVAAARAATPNVSFASVFSTNEALLGFRISLKNISHHLLRRSLPLRWSQRWERGCYDFHNVSLRWNVEHHATTIAVEGLQRGLFAEPEPGLSTKALDVRATVGNR